MAGRKISCHTLVLIKHTIPSSPAITKPNNTLILIHFNLPDASLQDMKFNFACMDDSVDDNLLVSSDSTQTVRNKIMKHTVNQIKMGGRVCR